MKRIGVVYHEFPHYRKAIMKEMENSNKYEYFFASSSRRVFGSVERVEMKGRNNSVTLECYKLGPLFIQFGLYRLVKKYKLDGLIVLGNPYFICQWIELPLIRLSGTPILMWTHGWLAIEEGLLKTKIRKTYFELSDCLLLYGNRAKSIGLKLGFKLRQLNVIYNSLDYNLMRSTYESVSVRKVNEFREDAGYEGSDILLIASSRLVKKCNYESVFRVIAELENSDRKYHMLIVGDGEEKANLESLAAKLKISVSFYGACYVNEALALMYKSADLCVFPGNIGLTAIQSLTYGTPVLTHDNFDLHGPEHEVIVPGENGDFFIHNNEYSLKDKIEEWSLKKRMDSAISLRCVDSITTSYTPAKQVEYIEHTINELML